MNIIYKLEDDLTIRKIKDELFVYDRKSGRVHTFNSTGDYIWQLIEQKTPYPDIVSSITQKFEVSIETSQHDVFQFFRELENKQLVQIKEISDDTL